MREDGIAQVKSPCQDWFLHSDADLKNKLNLLIAIHFLGKYVKSEKKEAWQGRHTASSSINISLT